jgi:TctA family transporter
MNFLLLIKTTGILNYAINLQRSIKNPLQAIYSGFFAFPLHG